MLQGHCRGFTLIELMIIIVVIAVIALYGVSFVKIESRTRLINKTAVEMKNILEASLGYFAENTHWPADLDKLNPKYLADPQLQCSGWPSTSSSGICKGRKSYQILSNQRALFFTISIQVGNKEAADQISAQMPSGYSTSSGGYWYATGTVPMPGSKHGWLAGAGIIGDEKKIPMPKCPPGFVGHFIEAPQYMKTGKFLKNTEITFGNNNVNVQVGHRRLDFDKDKGLFYIKAQNEVHSPTSKSRYLAWFLTFCIPPEEWHISPAAVADQSLTAMQCDASWKQYNPEQVSGCS